MSATAIILAAPDIPQESELVGMLSRVGSPLSVRRRCVDALDLIGAAAEGSAKAAIVSAGLPRLTRDTIARLTSGDLVLIGLAADEDDERRLRDFELPVVRMSGSDIESTVKEIETLIVDPRAGARAPAQFGEGGDRAPSSPGSIVAVWGPAGAPGRTSVSVAIADERARDGQPALLVDADTVGGGAVATHLGVLDDTSGIVVACRQADTGRLGPAELAGAARAIDGTLRVLTGIPRADRWAELRPAALVRLWEACRATPGLTVIDAGSSLERDEELLSDVRSPRRAAATLTALAAADVVVAVGRADPVGIERLAHGLADLKRAVPDTPVHVIVNRVRRSVLGPDPQGQIREALLRHAGVSELVLVPEDRDAFDGALLQGRSLADVAPRSTARGVLREFASSLAWSGPQAVAA